MNSGTVVAGYLDPGKWSACFGLSYRDLLFHDAAHHRRFARELREVTGLGGVPAGRNRVTRRFLDDTAGEWLWFVDTDMGFEADTVDRLVATADPDTRPVVGALCFAVGRQADGGPMHAERFRIQPTVYRWLDGSPGPTEPVLDYPPDSVVPVAATGAACILIHRSALEKVRDQFGDAWFGQIPDGDRMLSEDLSFCVRLATCGVPVHVDTRVKTTHDKGWLFLDEGTYDRQMMLLMMGADA